MRCKYCQSKLGFWRSLSDREYCNDEHRRRGRNVTSRAARESIIYGDDELYDLVRADKKKQKQSRLQAQIIVVLSTVMIGVLAFSAATGSTGGQALAQRGVSLTGELSHNNPLIAKATAYFDSIIPSGAPLNIHDDFRTGISGWVGGRTSEWRSDKGIIQPNGLRVWKPSLKLADYRMEFEGQIEKNALSWAFRAPDLKNYYATKIVVKRNGAVPVADIIRYTVLNGMERERQRLPLPMSIRPDTLYHVQMSVRGNQFVTKVNGQVVDTWVDSRLKRGGVGFFTEKGEVSSIHWVDVREEREGIFNRLFSMGFFVMPVEFID